MKFMKLTESLTGKPIWVDMDYVYELTPAGTKGTKLYLKNGNGTRTVNENVEDILFCLAGRVVESSVWSTTMAKSCDINTKTYADYMGNEKNEE